MKVYTKTGTKNHSIIWEERVSKHHIRMKVMELLTAKFYWINSRSKYESIYTKSTNQKFKIDYLLLELF